MFFSVKVALRETTNEENQKFFSDLTQFVNPSDHAENSNHPAFAFKKGLIQLIANMSYKNTSNQNDVCRYYKDVVDNITSNQG